MWRWTESRTLLRVFVAALFVCAMAALVLSAVFGFEEPNGTLLILSLALLLSALLAVFAHLVATPGLTRAQKRRWLHELTGRRGIRAWSEYLSCDDVRWEAVRVDEEGSHHAGEQRRR